MDDNSGPHISVAAICEKVLHEKDGVFTLVRLIDRFLIRGSSRKMPATSIGGTLVLIFKSGGARGSHTLGIKLQKPTGAYLKRLDFPVFFEGDDRGAVVIGQANFTLDEEGLYWIDVIFEDSVITRMPIRIVYQWIEQSGGDQESEQQN